MAGRACDRANASVVRSANSRPPLLVAWVSGWVWWAAEV